MNVRKISENDTIKAGDTLYDRAPNTTGFKPITVERVTKTGRIVAGGLTYAKEGYALTDTYMRRRLYVAAQQETPESK